jgi:tRNA modification GTPase
LTEALLTGAARLAEPGEFTRRAYENGKLDLSQAEATADLVEAETAAQAHQAIRQLEGAMGRRYCGWRERLIGLIARLEAALDFPEEDLPPDVLNDVGTDLGGMIADLGHALSDGKRGLRVREGYRIALIGAPNAGKSTLANVLAGRDAAIVSELAGTTRDVIEMTINFAGHTVVVADMAGIRQAIHHVEKEGVRRAFDWAERADLRLWVVDRAANKGAWREAERLIRPDDICLLNKSDLTEGKDGLAARRAARSRGLQVVEAGGPGGCVALNEILLARVRDDLAGSEFPAATRARHVKLLTEARERLEAAVTRLPEIDLAVEDIRLAVRALERVTGRVGAEDILDEVFKRFCIGK